MKKKPRRNFAETNFLKKTSDEIYLDLLGYTIDKTSLEQIPETQWTEFTTQRGLNPNSYGIYLPRNQTAIIREENPLSLFHEYYGHGFYCEQSLQGRKLVDLEKKLLEEEKQEFSNSRFTLEDVQKFREGNKTFRELEKFKHENLGRYEGFAVFSEYFLSKEFGFESLFEQKYEKLNGDFGNYFGEIISFNKNFGDLATFYGFGMGRKQDKKRLLKLSNDLFRKSLNRTKLITHFGSGKPFSDIDLFVISNEIKSFHSNWIDVRAYTIDEIEDKIKLLEPKITDPVMAGKFVYGDESYQNVLKNKILNQEITEDAIKSNLDMWQHHNKRSQDNSIEEHFRGKNLRSSKTYLTNALAMRNGDKVLTFNGLVDYAQKRFSHSEKFIELKGGIE